MLRDNHETVMSPDTRTLHHITAEEAELVFCFRTLSLSAKGAVLALIASQIAVDCQDIDTVVRLALVCKDRA